MVAARFGSAVPANVAVVAVIAVTGDVTTVGAAVVVNDRTAP